MSLRLLCIVAHPDDECFAFGGALALAAQRGIETAVLCLTDGQAATHRGTAQTGAQLGAMRAAEFAASCEILGAHRRELLAYQDAQLECHTLYELGGLLVERMRQFRPHLVLTFGGEGALNNHPDHTSVSAAATAAFHWSGNAKRFPEQASPGARNGSFMPPPTSFSRTVRHPCPRRGPASSISVPCATKNARPSRRTPPRLR